MVEDVLRRHDPIQLISIGAPPGEYDPEVGTILPRLRAVLSCDDVQELLYEEFTNWFGSEQVGPLESYADAARELWEGWLVLEAQRLSAEVDVEIVDPTSSPVRFGKEVLDPVTVVRVAERYFVETKAEPGKWWMGELTPNGELSVWGQYGPYPQAFAQH